MGGGGAGGEGSGTDLVQLQQAVPAWFDYSTPFEPCAGPNLGGVATISSFGSVRIESNDRLL